LELELFNPCKNDLKWGPGKNGELASSLRRSLNAYGRQVAGGCFC